MVRRSLGVRGLTSSIVKTLTITIVRYIRGPLAPQRKYYNLTMYTVGPSILGHSIMADTRTRRITPSHADTYTSRTQVTLLRRLILFLVSSSRPSSSPLRFPISDIAPSHCIVYLTRKADMQLLIWGYKFLREIARRMPHFSGEPPGLHPAFSPGGPASIVAHAEGPVAFDTPRIVYSEDDERALEEFARAKGAWLLPFSVSFAHHSHTFFLPLALGPQSPRATTQ
jgi:hypothetical protein